jgi:anti-sigma regulatory factor (Ser/Thr protein kinase)
MREKARARDGTTVETMTMDEFRMDMLASVAAAGLARTLVEQRLIKWGLRHVADDTHLITAELVANAVVATPGQKIHFRISRDASGLLIEVWDSSNEVPRPKPLMELDLDSLDLSEEGFDLTGGWGLPIIQALSQDCGYTPSPGGGETVWARVKA